MKEQDSYSKLKIKRMESELRQLRAELASTDFYKFDPNDYSGIESDYLFSMFCNKTFVEKIDRAVVALEIFRKRTKFDSIAYTGVSGSLCAIPISYIMKIPLICVRKSLKNSHSSSYVEGYMGKRYIIIDDFISSGKTINRILNKVSDSIEDSKCVGILLYMREESYWSQNYHEYKDKKIRIIRYPKNIFKS
jgi:orotate phosphoribosyltransferase